MFIHQRHNFVTSAFPVLHAMQSLGGKSSLSLKEGSRFDLEMCMSATPRSLAFILPSHSVPSDAYKALGLGYLSFWDHHPQESSLAPYCPQGEVGVPPLASRPCLTQPCISSTAPPSLSPNVLSSPLGLALHGTHPPSPSSPPC